MSMAVRMVYGVESKRTGNGWVDCVYCFRTKEDARKWYSERTGSEFRVKQIVTKTQAIKIAGKKSVDEAMCLSWY